MYSLTSYNYCSLISSLLTIKKDVDSPQITLLLLYRVEIEIEIYFTGYKLYSKNNHKYIMPTPYPAG